MKTFNKYFFYGIFLFIPVFFSCKSNKIAEDDDSCDIVMTDGKIQKPEWLKSIIDSVSNIYASRYADYAPSIFTVKYQDQDYILVRDNLCSSISLSYLFLSCPGRKVIPESDLWRELMDEVLPCDIKFADDRIQSPQWLVHAIDSVANCYWPRGALTPPVNALPYKEQVYIVLTDMAASTMSRGYIFFTCLGEKAVPESDLWNELVDEYLKNSDKMLLIWVGY
jgi:hypothetical protein